MQTDLVKAFSTLEMMIVVAIFGLVAVMLAPFTLSQISSNRLVNSAKLLESSIITQRQNGYNSIDQSSYGILFEWNQYTLFTGDSFASATSTELFTLPQGVTITEINLTNSSNEVVYLNSTFRPSESGTLLLSDGNRTYTLQINEEGLVDLYINN